MAQIATKTTAELSTDINVITAEINAYQRVAGEAIFEIGRRLKHVKENDLAHGEFGDWLESIGMSPRTAQRFIKIVDELGTKATTWTHLGMRVLSEIATLPPEERERPHTIPSTGETKTVDEMTVRELREVKRQLRLEQQAREMERVGAERVYLEKAEIQYELRKAHDEKAAIEYQSPIYRLILP